MSGQGDIDPELQDGLEGIVTEPLDGVEKSGLLRKQSVGKKLDGGEEGSDGKGGTVRITVHPPELRKEGKFGVGSYHTYKVTMIPNEVEHVFRRYKDFEWVRTSLVAWHPCLFVPPLPPKKTFGNTDEKFVADRRGDLQRFLIRCAGIPHLANSPPFRMFMSRATTFEEGMKEIEAKTKERVVLVVLKEYKENFPHVFDTEKAIEGADAKLAALKEFMENSEKKITNLVTETEALATAFATYTTILGKVTIGLESVHTEEKGFPQRPEPARFDALDSMHQWHQGAKQIMPHYSGLFAKNFVNELQDIQAFLELFKQRDYILAEQKKAAKAADKWKAMKTLTPQQETTKTEDIEKEAGWTEILQGTTQLILGPEMLRYWKERTAGYKTSIISFATEQLGVAKQSVGIWETVSGSS